MHLGPQTGMPINVGTLVGVLHLHGNKGLHPPPPTHPTPNNLVCCMHEGALHGHKATLWLSEASNKDKCSKHMSGHEASLCLTRCKRAKNKNERCMANKPNA